ncbi:MAG TPA: HAD family hydrolase [Roseiarcus sp.]|jgi:FMN phosphatase YigB (HAD superfamily)
MTAAVETLLFDFGGTLDADGVAWKERFYALYQAEGLDLTVDAFAQAFYAADDPLVGSLPPTAGSSETVNALTANIEVELLYRGVGASRDRGTRVASRFLSDMSDILLRNRPVLEKLSKHYRMGVVSNFYGNLEAVCLSSGLAPLFAVMTDSHCVGAEKPDPAIFRAALETLEAAPETTIFIGDSLRRDCEGARRAGMGFIWIAPEDVQAAAAQTTAPRSLPAAVTRLPDLLNVLK